MEPDATLHPSLAQLILADDPDAIAGFRDAHAGQVRRYCAYACPPELRDEAFEAAFVDFLGRLHATGMAEVNLEDLLFKATRASAAARFDVEAPPPENKWASTGMAHPQPVDARCLGVPEVLAAYTNGELQEGDRQLRGHLERCATCKVTVARMERAERALSETEEAPPASKWEAVAKAGAVPEPRPAAPEQARNWEAVGKAGAVPEPEPPAPAPTPPEPAAPEQTSPKPEPAAPEPAAPEPQTKAPPAPTPQPVRVRRGGLIGAARRVGRRPSGRPGGRP
jgi:hypothetical protein